jgi:hypothetical protein
MRGAIAVIGCILAASLGLRIVVGNLSGELSLLGYFVVALCLAGGILVLPLPGPAAFAFAIACVLGFLAAAAAREFIGWGAVALLLCLAALVSARAKRRADRHAAATDAWLRQSVSATTPDLSRRDGPR